MKTLLSFCLGVSILFPNFCSAEGLNIDFNHVDVKIEWNHDDFDLERDTLDTSENCPITEKNLVCLSGYLFIKYNYGYKGMLTQILVEKNDNTHPVKCKVVKERNIKIGWEK